MKAKSILILALLMVIKPVALSAETESRDSSASNNPVGIPNLRRTTPSTLMV